MVCGVPWTCPYTAQEQVQKLAIYTPTLDTCRKFLSTWFGLRKSLEEDFLLPSERIKPTGTFHPEIFMGYCQPGGLRGKGSYEYMHPTKSNFPNGLEKHTVQKEEEEAQQQQQQQQKSTTATDTTTKETTTAATKETTAVAPIKEDKR
mmetsp:Transcript_21663/g.50005  ORF Transcript_21663/g.50005 Transcript_21663/m.50005 type:complete len:148 (+) Transcript_21663:123-566(+)